MSNSSTAPFAHSAFARSLYENSTVSQNVSNSSTLLSQNESFSAPFRTRTAATSNIDVNAPPLTSLKATSPFKALSNRPGQTESKGENRFDSSVSKKAVRNPLTEKNNISSFNRFAKPELLEKPGGYWRHPALDTVEKTLHDKTPSDRTWHRLVTNLSAFILFHIFKQWFSATKIVMVRYILLALQVMFLYNFVEALWRFIRPRETFRDVNLTPGQRQLLGLPVSPGASTAFQYSSLSDDQKETPATRRRT
ncbi:nucleoporin Pom34 [Schizosaccharomyces japonicus yFS275]|uniref:Nucleoporin Pom34 n=1 Tax=Schizosaccharomyces japonicus (strain yFS275 / FY16936) TaxID=402676 RepID=B6K3U0_SCHJY|nr:nucleoporin Pom34 [Schizosaccharomyces japonicus yFS275]EEB08147.1 nucleoporin Pom34 [Schizosaccharomyces japonicus yFS275]